MCFLLQLVAAGTESGQNLLVQLMYIFAVFFMATSIGCVVVASPEAQCRQSKTTGPLPQHTKAG